jgi:hypothetical protein
VPETKNISLDQMNQLFQVHNSHELNLYIKKRLKYIFGNNENANNKIDVTSESNEIHVPATSKQMSIPSSCSPSNEISTPSLDISIPISCLRPSALSADRNENEQEIKYDL